MSVSSVVERASVRAPAPAVRSVRTVGREELIWAVRLALGMSDGLHAVRDWPGVLHAAIAERCASLAWVRCGPAISLAAPPEITTAFRSHFAANTVRVHSALSSAQSVASALKERGISPIMLKGPPLALRLYGDFAARVCSDLDWFVPTAVRPTVHDVMLRHSWRVIEGDGGEGTCYGWSNQIGETYIEVHSSLFHPRYAYLTVPAPTGKSISIEGMVVVAHDDALLPGYLATHLAMHRFAPLAWLIDVLELWSSLDESDRAEGRRAAQAYGLHRYLGWALGRVGLLRSAANGDVAAAKRLGLRTVSRVDPHPMWRHVALAPGAASMARAAWTWIAPYWVERRGASSLGIAIRRVARHWREALPASQPLA